MTSVTTRRPILIVDDDREIVEAMVDFLGAEGLRAVGARSGSEAEQVAVAERPSLVLLDNRLGRDSGAKVAERLRARCGAGLPIVLVSGAHDLSDVARAAGVVATLAKPFSIDDLLPYVMRHAAVH